MEFGKGYIVTFKQSQASFAWNRSYIPEATSPGKERATHFSWKDSPDYIVIDVVDIEGADSIQEIGVFQDGICIGAVKTETLPCQILAYPDYENPAPLEFEVVLDSKDRQSANVSYEILDLKDFSYRKDHIIPEIDGLYQVKLAQDAYSLFSPNQNNVLSVSNYPNPFNPETRISFSLAEKADANILIYNAKGQLVRDMGINPCKSGVNTRTWDGKDNSGISVSSGIYFLKIKTQSGSLTHKILMMK